MEKTRFFIPKPLVAPRRYVTFCQKNDENKTKYDKIN